MHFIRAVGLTLGALLTVGASACTPLSVDQERSLGADFSRNFRRRADLVKNPAVTRYVAAIGERLLAQAEPQPFTYRFHVVAKAEVNAFAGPAGHIYLYSGTLLKARNVSEVAAVIAHEIGHVARRHVATNFNRALATNILHQVGVAAAELTAGPNAGRAAQTFGGLAAAGYLSTFSREAEHEADAFAVQLLFRAGYDPRGLATFFATLRNEGTRSASGFLSSHPATSARIANTRRLIGRLPGEARLQVHDAGRLQQIQRILGNPGSGDEDARGRFHGQRRHTRHEAGGIRATSGMHRRRPHEQRHGGPGLMSPGNDCQSWGCRPWNSFI